MARDKGTKRYGVENDIAVYKLFSAETITASADSTSDAVCLHGRVGIFSIDYTITGTGTAKIEYLVSHDGVNFRDPSTATDIGTGLTVGSDLLPFEPELGTYIQIKVTETGGANSVVVTLSLAVQ